MLLGSGILHSPFTLSSAWVIPTRPMVFRFAPLPSLRLSLNRSQPLWTSSLNVSSTRILTARSRSCTPSTVSLSTSPCNSKLNLGFRWEDFPGGRTAPPRRPQRFETSQVSLPFFASRRMHITVARISASTSFSRLQFLKNSKDTLALTIIPAESATAQSIISNWYVPFLAYPSPSAPFVRVSSPLCATEQPGYVLTASSVNHLRTFMVNCKFHLWASLPVSAFNGLHRIAPVDITTSSRFVDIFVLRMDCIYLSQKFGRPLVRRLIPSSRFDQHRL